MFIVFVSSFADTSDIFVHAKIVHAAATAILLGIIKMKQLLSVISL